MPLDEQRDQARVRILDEEIDVVGEIEAHLVAARDHVVELHATLGRGMAEILHGAAGLRDHGDRAGREPAQVGVGIAEIFLRSAIAPMQLGPHTRSPLRSISACRAAPRATISGSWLAELARIDVGS